MQCGIICSNGVDNNGDDSAMNMMGTANGEAMVCGINRNEDTAECNEGNDDVDDSDCIEDEVEEATRCVEGDIIESFDAGLDIYGYVQCTDMAVPDVVPIREQYGNADEVELEEAESLNGIINMSAEVR